MMPFPFSKSEDKNIPNQNLMKDAGVSIGLFEDLYVHAKIIIVDDKVMYVGSGNFYTSSIDQTRELGIIIKNASQIKALKAVFEKDWQHSKINQDR
jgi:phosphatidylserine/phosphatidylglycerophosphate/cardiolipin synthase-like enzyme